MKRTPEENSENSGISPGRLQLDLLSTKGISRGIIGALFIIGTTPVRSPCVYHRLRRKLAIHLEAIAALIILLKPRPEAVVLGG